MVLHYCRAWMHTSVFFSPTNQTAGNSFSWKGPYPGAFYINRWGMCLRLCGVRTSYNSLINAERIYLYCNVNRLTNDTWACQTWRHRMPVECACIQGRCYGQFRACSAGERKGAEQFYPVQEQQRPADPVQEYKDIIFPDKKGNLFKVTVNIHYINFLYSAFMDDSSDAQRLPGCNGCLQ